MASDRRGRLAGAGAGRASTVPPSPIADDLATLERLRDWPAPGRVGLKGGQKGELRQAEPVFRTGRRPRRSPTAGSTSPAIYQREGPHPRRAAWRWSKAANHPRPAAPWVISWLSGQIDERNGYLEAGDRPLPVGPGHQDPGARLRLRPRLRGHQRPRLGQHLQPAPGCQPLGSPERPPGLAPPGGRHAFRRTIAIDSENVAAHYGLGLAYNDLGSRATVVPTSTRPVEPPCRHSSRRRLSGRTGPRRVADLSSPGSSDRRIKRGSVTWRGAVPAFASGATSPAVRGHPG